MRGFHVRKRWRADPHAVVAELHSAIERERATKQKRIEAKARLEVRTFPGAWRIGLVGAWRMVLVLLGLVSQILVDVGFPLF